MKLPRLHLLQGRTMLHQWVCTEWAVQPRILAETVWSSQPNAASYERHAFQFSERNLGFHFGGFTQQVGSLLCNPGSAKDPLLNASYIGERPGLRNTWGFRIVR